MPNLLSDYINITEMCIAQNKRVNDYIRLSTTKAYLNAVSLKQGIPVSELIIVYQGGSAVTQQGTWIHLQIQDHFTNWLHKGKNLFREKEIQNTLSSYLEEAQQEVHCPAGKIDILTPWEIIEVKAVDNWITAVGQLIVYGYYYPNHSKRLHLFGDTQARLCRIIEKHCKELAIKVTYED